MTRLVEEQCPTCGASGVERDDAGLHCTYCGSRLVATPAPGDGARGADAAGYEDEASRIRLQLTRLREARDRCAARLGMANRNAGQPASSPEAQSAVPGRDDSPHDSNRRRRVPLSVSLPVVLVLILLKASARSSSFPGVLSILLFLAIVGGASIFLSVFSDNDTSDHGDFDEPWRSSRTENERYGATRYQSEEQGAASYELESLDRRIRQLEWRLQTLTGVPAGSSRRETAQAP